MTSINNKGQLIESTIIWSSGHNEIFGSDKDGNVIYYTINYSWEEIECTVWSESNPEDPKHFVARFKEKKGTRKR